MFFNMKFSIVFLLNVIYVYFGSAQVVKGKVLGLNNTVLINANVILVDSNKNVIGTVTDEKGFYYFNLPSSGKYKMTCSYVGYENKETILTINSSESLQIDCKLSPLTKGDFITITEKPYQSGDLTMTQNQYKVMPASFQDPARILIKYPGFSTPNDGANAIIFRGMPPESARWQLFGADIVNPNHLSNAGTANDLATGNAGGVNALSGSVLDYYHFEANPADVSYADVMSGVSNMKMAPKINSFVDINLIGLEAGLGLSRGNKNVYASYRYSFVGLLDKLGVNFGNEKIGYQDLSMYADLIKNDHHSLKIFATLGNSSNIFSAVSRKDSLTRFKDIQNITYKSEMILGGAQFTYEKSNKYFQSTLVSSGRNDNREEFTDDFYADSLGLSLASNQEIKERLLSWHNQFVVDYSNAKMTIGLRTNLKKDGRIFTDEDNAVLSIYPYIQYNSAPFKTFQYRVGLGSFFDNISSRWSIEPSIGVGKKMGLNFSLNVDYRYATFQNSVPNGFTVYYYSNSYRVKGHHLQTSIQYSRKSLELRGTIFLHNFNDLETFSTLSSIYDEHLSPFNGNNLGYDQFFYPEVILSGRASRARVYGAEMYFENKTYIGKNVITYAVNGSLFKSEYALNNFNEKYYDSRYNFGYTSNVNISYTMDISKSDKQRKLILSLSNHYRGAMREQSLNPINGEFSTLYDIRSSYNGSFRPYQRLDFRIVYNKQKSGNKKTHRWSLDIQNLLNRENDGFRYYDPLLNSVLLQKQLGLVPVLSYRLEW
jgi:hypothetical protein